MGDIKNNSEIFISAWSACRACQNLDSVAAVKKGAIRVKFLTDVSVVSAGGRRYSTCSHSLHCLP